MPYTIAVNDVIQLRTKATLFGQIVRTVLTYRCSIAGGANAGVADLNNFLNNMIGLTGTVTFFKAAQSPQLTYVELSGQVVAPTRRAVVKLGLTQSGTHPDPCTSANVAGTFTKLTELSTRRKLKAGLGGIGSVHLPGIPASGYDQGLLTTVYKSGPFANCIAPMMLPLVSVSGCQINPCLWHRNNPNTITTDLTAIITQDTQRTERRRTLRVGE